MSATTQPPPDDLAARTFTPISGAAAQQAQTDQHQADQAQQREQQLMLILELGTEKVITGVLRALRSRLAVKLPEIRDEWTDEVLAGPGQAAVPVLKRYAGSLVELLGEHVELAGLVISLIPLGMGYLAANEKAAKREANTVDVPADGQAA